MCIYVCMCECRKSEETRLGVHVVAERSEKNGGEYEHQGLERSFLMSGKEVICFCVSCVNVNEGAYM